jgi:nicotinamidase-related amidase
LLAPTGWFARGGGFWPDPSAEHDSLGPGFEQSLSQSLERIAGLGRHLAVGLVTVGALQRRNRDQKGDGIRFASVPLDVEELLRPAHTALVTQECQRGVLGDGHIFPALANAARERGMVARVAAAVHAARSAGVTVIHCVVGRREDNRGSNRNARLFIAAERSPTRLVQGTDHSKLLAELGPEPSDIVLTRMHGLSPMHGTELDAVLRNLGITTVVGVGVSINVAIVNLAFDAVNLGYQVVIPRDAVAGTPVEYADAVVEHTLKMVATVTDVDTLVDTWLPGAAAR